MPLAMLEKKVEGRDRVNVTCTGVHTNKQDHLRLAVK